uniref:Uncharacterized protein n=1 Tax=Arundo donax TaxID=35708 RepID=A0A0A9ARQ7_ARUDO
MGGRRAGEKHAATSFLNVILAESIILAPSPLPCSFVEYSSICQASAKLSLLSLPAAS